MYPQPELIRLAGHKSALRRVIARRRVECATAASRATHPLVWLDKALTLWRKFSPVAKLAVIPLVAIAGRSLLPRAKFVGSLLRWGPLAVAAIRSLGR